jgi:transglutaminase-like putative cysteine protease
LKDNPAAPGAHAMILYRQEHIDSADSFSKHYLRIKIFTKEGLQHANVEIPYLKGSDHITDIKARTIKPDGTVVEFKGDVFDKVVYRRKGVKVHVKTFSMPEVTEGSIIEYQYRKTWDYYELRGAYWEIEADLFTRKAKFSIRPYREYALFWRTYGRAHGKELSKKGGTLSLEVENIPPYEEEDYMPPDNVVKSHIHFFYSQLDRVPQPEEFWKLMGQAWYQTVEDFIGNRKGIRQAVASIISPSDSDEEKLRKIYRRVAQIRNLTYEPSKTEMEEKREKLKENTNVEQVLERGYGYRSEINRLFVAFARAAGFEAGVVRLCERDTNFFQPNLQDARQLDGEIAAVKLGGTERYFDPGTPFTPFGLLAWQKTNVRGIRLDQNGGVFITTPMPASKDALIERTADLELDEEGTLAGKLTVVYHGYQAAARRREALSEDDTGRRESLIEEVKDWFPAGAEIKLNSVNSWDEWEQPLQAEFSVELPSFAIPTGRRILLPVGVFHANKKHPFQHVRRVHPVYFRYPWQERDIISVKLPEGFAVETLPQPRTAQAQFAAFQVVPHNVGERTLRLERHLILEGFFFPLEYYGALRNFFTQVRAGDEEQVVLQASLAALRN